MLDPKKLEQACRDALAWFENESDTARLPIVDLLKDALSPTVKVAVILEVFREPLGGPRRCNCGSSDFREIRNRPLALTLCMECYAIFSLQ